MNKRKATTILFMVLFSASNLLSQNNNKNSSSTKDSAKQHRFDDSVDYYETAGIYFYHHSKYDTAIRKFTRAEHFIDSLSAMREKLADFINNIVTRCDVALAYTMRHKAGMGLREIPEIDHVRLWDLTGNNDLFGKSMGELLAFTQFTEGDCYRGLNLQKTLYYYLIAYGNLKSTHYYSDSTTLSYKYALKSYLYKDSYRDVMSSSESLGDSANINSYKSILMKISQDK